MFDTDMHETEQWRNFQPTITLALNWDFMQPPPHLRYNQLPENITTDTYRSQSR